MAAGVTNRSLTELLDQLRPYVGEGNPELLDRAAPLIDAIVREVDPANPLRRRLEVLAVRLVSGRPAWAAEVESAFDRTLARAVRQRNAILHGAAVETGMLLTVDSFVARLTTLVTQMRLHAFEAGEDFLDLMEEIRLRSWLDQAPTF